MFRFYRSLIAGALGLAALAGPAHSGTVEDESPATVSMSSSFSRLSLAPSLEKQRGKQGSRTLAITNTTSEADIDGTVGDTNIADSAKVLTGKNTIADGAFTGMTGIGTVFQNSGNNVLMQNITTVNVTMQ
ncbi:hypothetical protein [Crenobacter cavernae]|uniref:ESPR domain-containing protein n=1 Tax=Crenobacter cavernae TaxID=2290923 RepID=A0A345Y9I5_9NEIS|nr:hypothetical protein [Crenobacter cavernae]AXK40587.1 hypothetical protein DWG20_14765 [Crenobacter cavernae]